MVVNGLFYAETVDAVMMEVQERLRILGIAGELIRKPLLDAAELVGVTIDVSNEKAELTRRILATADITHGLNLSR